MPSESTPLFQPDQQESDREKSWRVAASCVGFMADSYDLFAIDLVIVILQMQYGESVFGHQEVSLTVSMMLVGLVLGQVTFGVVADSIGRKSASVMTAALTVLGALASAFCVHLPGVPIGLPHQLALCRGILGVGVGGEYPVSATMTSESANSQNRGRLLALVISMQGFGMLLARSWPWAHFIWASPLSLSGAYSWALVLCHLRLLLSCAGRCMRPKPTFILLRLERASCQSCSAAVDFLSGQLVHGFS